jgi:hypothetical protein
VVIAYLMKLRGWRLAESYKWVKDKRPSTNISEGACMLLPGPGILLGVTSLQFCIVRRRVFSAGRRCCCCSGCSGLLLHFTSQAGNNLIVQSCKAHITRAG